MRHNREKQQIVSINPELLLCENGDFKIKSDLLEKYEIIDMHCHIYNGLSPLFPTLLKELTKTNLPILSCSGIGLKRNVKF